MKIEFSQIDIIDDTAKRLMQYINKSNGKFNRSKIISNTAKDIISKCFGHNDYITLRSNLTSVPQRLSLNENEILKLKKQYLKILMDSLDISSELAEELWMASYPYEELPTSDIFTIGYIGKYTYEWKKPDEYGENTKKYVNIYNYVIAIRCVKCKERGVITPQPIEENSDMENPPSFSYDDECDWCHGTGIFHKPYQKLNKIRLTKKELELQHEFESYYQSFIAVGWVKP